MTERTTHLYDLLDGEGSRWPGMTIGVSSDPCFAENFAAARARPGHDRERLVEIELGSVATEGTGDPEPPQLADPEN